jgi:outer membrane protein TolC
LQVRAAAVQAAINLRASRVSLEQAERLVANAAANLDQATGRYQSGAAPLLETIDAQAADAGARITVVRARLALQIAQVNLLIATGDLERLVR